jgi:hypothetical protein
VHFVGLFLFITENARSKKQDKYVLQTEDGRSISAGSPLP